LIKFIILNFLGGTTLQAWTGKVLFSMLGVTFMGLAIWVGLKPGSRGHSRKQPLIPLGSYSLYNGLL